MHSTICPRFHSRSPPIMSLRSLLSCPLSPLSSSPRSLVVSTLSHCRRCLPSHHLSFLSLSSFASPPSYCHCIGLPSHWSFITFPPFHCHRRFSFPFSSF